MINVELTNKVSEKQIAKYKRKVKKINTAINNKTGEGNDFLGWADWPINLNKKELTKIIKDAKYVREHFDVLVVCGIGGSYLGARSALDALEGTKHNKHKIEVIYLGQTFSPDYISKVLTYLEDKKFAINVISKSGTTTETSIAFRLLKELLIEKVGKARAKRAIYAVTDKEKGALKSLCAAEGYTIYNLPKNIGGRYSVLTPVGLFAIAVAGYDIKAMISGAIKAREDCSVEELANNPCYKYAVVRDILNKKNHKNVEMFVTYDPLLNQMAEWLKQLFGESEGKDGKGLLPTSASFSTDLHSLGQYIQEGSPILFETIIKVINPACDVLIPHDDSNRDGLNYLEGKTLSYVNQMAFEGTLKAHSETGEVPCNVITLDKMDEFNLGYLYYFFMRACAMSAYLLKVNPFNQPGVEVYKQNMFHLLGKEGY